jgi:dTDP-L-oleandrosyltransferase
LKKEIIYIGFGTICDPGPQFFRNCLAAFADIDMQVVMLLSASTTPEDLGDVPDNFIVWSVDRDGLVPQLEILPRAKLFVMNGGMGGARESAWFGVPMLAIPTTFETDLISTRIEQQGAGIRRPVDANPLDLRAAAKRLMSTEGYAQESARIGDACRRAGGAKRAVDVLKAFVADGVPAETGRFTMAGRPA